MRSEGSSADSAVGMMDGAYFISRKDLLDFFNDLLQLNLTKIEQTASGAVACQLTEYIFPGSIPLRRVNWEAKSSYEFIQNYKLLQVAFDKHRVQKHVDVDRLIRAKYQDNLEFCQWLKAFYDQAGPSKRERYDPVVARCKGKGGKNMSRKVGNNGSKSLSTGRTTAAHARAPVNPARKTSRLSTGSSSSQMSAGSSSSRMSAGASSSRMSLQVTSTAKGKIPKTTPKRLSNQKENTPKEKIAAKQTKVQKEVVTPMQITVNEENTQKEKSTLLLTSCDKENTGHNTDMFPLSSKKRQSAACPSTPGEFVVSDDTIMKKNNDLMKRNAELQLSFSGVENERDFYFEKLKDIEFLLQEREHCDPANLNERIFNVLYAALDEKDNSNEDENVLDSISDNLGNEDIF